MDGYQADKKYEQLKIPDRRPGWEDGVAQASPQAKANPHSPPDGLYYEIEYDACNIPGVSKFVLKAQKIEPLEKDGVRELLHRMRDIAREDRSVFLGDFSFFDRRVRQEDAKTFYRQGLFMKDFTDQYAQSAPYSAYFPYYQMMGYEQLRTYFTWRTEVRKGNVAETSLSYAFLYIYELLNNIGVEDPQEGLDKLMFFWKAFRAYHKTIDKYMLRWLKDYHIYYELAQSFKAFVDQNGLAAHYPGLAHTDDEFELFCAVSKYDIRKSAFFTGGNAKLSADCFRFLIERLRRIFAENGMDFDGSVFQPTKKISAWMPFQNALFYPWLKQKDRRVVLAENEIYLCSRNKWMFSTVPAGESGRQLVGYVMKRMESVLRKAVKYKYKLSANADAVEHAALGRLNEAGLSLENIIGDVVLAFYREATKTIVRVDHGALSQIRREALATQAKLIVPEPGETFVPAAAPPESALPVFADMHPFPLPDDEPASASDAWAGFKDALSAIEIGALSAALGGEAEIRKYAGECGVMPEVLVDGINEKAMDFIGDSLMDEGFFLYGDYKDQLKELVGCV